MRPSRSLVPEQPERVVLGTSVLLSTAGATIIVTGDRRLLAGAVPGIRILTVAEAVERFRLRAGVDWERGADFRVAK